MPSLAEIARPPDVTGSIIRGTQGRAFVNEVREQDRQRENLQSLNEMFRDRDLSDPTQRQEIQQGAFNLDAETGFRVREAFSQMSAEELEQSREEARRVAVALAGVNDQSSYDRARAGLGAQGIDISPLPEQFDPAMRDFLVNSAREIEDVAARTPEQFAQDLALRTAGRPTTTVNVGPQGQDFGDPPKDMVFARNPDGSIATQEITTPEGQTFVTPIAVPIEGGTVAREQAEVEAAAEAREAAASQATNVVSESANQIRRIVQEAQLPTTGLVGSFLSNIGGTAARNLAAELDTIKANVGFERLQQMRNASPTGGALGQVSERENLLLQSTLGSLEQSQSEDEFLRNLARVEEAFRILVGGTPEERDRLLEGGDEATGISSMSLEQLQALDPVSLSDEDLAAAARRFEELTRGR